MHANKQLVNNNNLLHLYSAFLGTQSTLHSKGDVVNCFLLKCRKLRREDQETSDWIVSRIRLLRTQAVGICSHRNFNLK